MTDARTPSDHHQDAQDALVEDRATRPPNAMRAVDASQPPWLQDAEARVAAFDMSAALADDDVLISGINAANSVLAEWAIDLVNGRDIRNVLAAIRHLGLTIDREGVA